jgi:hypothetical protein
MMTRALWAKYGDDRLRLVDSTKLLWGCFANVATPALSNMPPADYSKVQGTLWNKETSRLCNSHDIIAAAKARLSRERRSMRYNPAAYRGVVVGCGVDAGTSVATVA